MRICFNSDVLATLTIDIFNAPLCIPNKRVTPSLVLLKLLWSKKEIYHDSLEELFIRQNIADLKVTRYKVFIFDFAEFKISGDLTKPGCFL